MKTNYNEILSKSRTIDTARLILRPFRDGDEECIYEYGSDEQTLKYLIWTGVQSLEEAKVLIYNYYLSKNGIFAIEEKSSGKCIGSIDFNLDEQHEKAQFGYVLLRRCWNQGYMSETLSALIDFYFDKLELNRIEATHYMGNEGSGRVMEKCGMKKEGIGISEVKVKGVFHDVVHYGITRKDWMAALSL